MIPIFEVEKRCRVRTKFYTEELKETHLKQPGGSGVTRSTTRAINASPLENPRLGKYTFRIPENKIIFSLEKNSSHLRFRKQKTSDV
jgi:hypothetical protein